MNKQIVEMASQLSQMTPKGVEQETFYNFAFGALHALARAEELGYRNQNKALGKSARRSAVVKKLAARIAKRGITISRGEWLAGYYYNDALLRMDIAYEHALRYRTGGKNGNASQQIKKALNGGMPKQLLDPSWIRLRYKEANPLKHHSEKFGEGPEIEPDDAVKILEDLIKTVKWVLKHKRA
ncbi:MAG: hypothetical protein A3H49_03215 [Nitrospirae bacterium RIFCSPLOWO2_02_FULL_62_14]|nr:MAG: hypothetical protein A3H49_03215 [Nitrospirae bacterium RIFCSPLOWO2_02_FULL_62_14]OGW68908.1 MAG: hypothetical protein A3A88_01555 [Nitrospirae bacterium RIFCSPLOWO2_01_FULL_62_17]